MSFESGPEAILRAARFALWGDAHDCRRSAERRFRIPFSDSSSVEGDEIEGRASDTKIKRKEGRARRSVSMGVGGKSTSNFGAYS